MYTSRNVFTLPDINVGDADGEECAKEIDKELAETKELGAQLTETRLRHLGLSAEFREAEQMLADMKSSLFGKHGLYSLAYSRN